MKTVAYLIVVAAIVFAGYCGAQYAKKTINGYIHTQQQKIEAINKM